MFLTGIADAYFQYDVTRTLAYGFSFDTKTLGELLVGAAETVGNIFSALFGGLF